MLSHGMSSVWRVGRFHGTIVLLAVFVLACGSSGCSSTSNSAPGLPQAIVEALKTGDNGVLAPYLPSRRDYVVSMLGEGADDVKRSAVLMEIDSATEVAMAIERARECGTAAGLKWRRAALTRAMQYDDWNMEACTERPYRKKALVGERALEAFETIGGWPRGIPADWTLAVELKSGERALSVLFSVGRTQRGPRLLSSLGCAALPLHELKRVAHWNPGRREDDAAIARLIMQGRMSVEFPKFRGGQNRHAPRRWIVLPEHFSPAETEWVTLWEDDPMTRQAQFQLLRETREDSLVFETAVGPGPEKVTLAIPQSDAQEAAKRDVVHADIDGVARKFRRDPRMCRLYVAPQVQTTVLRRAEGKPGLRIRFEDGLATDVVSHDGDSIK